MILVGGAGRTLKRRSGQWVRINKRMLEKEARKECKTEDGERGGGGNVEVNVLKNRRLAGRW